MLTFLGSLPKPKPKTTKIRKGSIVKGHWRNGTWIYGHNREAHNIRRTKCESHREIN